SSPELLNLYERERAAVSVLHEAAAERAPARLRLGIQGQRISSARRRRVAGYGFLAGAIAAAAIAVVLVLPGGAPGSPSVSQAAVRSGESVERLRDSHLHSRRPHRRDVAACRSHVRAIRHSRAPQRARAARWLASEQDQRLAPRESICASGSSWSVIRLATRC